MSKTWLIGLVFTLASFCYGIDSVEFVNKCKISAAGKLAEVQGYPHYCTYQYITRAALNGSDAPENIDRVFNIVYDAVLSKDTPEEFDKRLSAYLNFDKGVVKDEWLLPAYCEVILYKMELKRNPDAANLDPDMLSTEHNAKCQQLLGQE